MKIYPGSAILPAHSASRNVPSNIGVGVPHLVKAFSAVGNTEQKLPPMAVDQRLAGLSAKVASLETKLNSVWPLPQNLALHVRYQFGSYPCSYNDLMKAGNNVQSAVMQCRTALAALEGHGRIEKGDEKMISNLLDAITHFDKQCEIWSEIVSGSRKQGALSEKGGLDESVLNPFVGVRNNLVAIRAPLMGQRVV